MRINFELLDLRAFLAVIDFGGFHRAADHLAMSQPALTRRIQGLEAAIGAPLFERSTRKVALTAIGRGLEPLVRRMIDELETSLLSIGDLGRVQHGQVNIACIPTAAFYFLPRVVQAFNALYPRIRFRIVDEGAGECLASVARGEVEFGLNLLGASDPDLTFTPLSDDPFVLACRRDHPLAERDDLTWTDLQDMPLIGVSKSSGNRVLLDTALSKSAIRLQWLCEVNHLSTSLGLVEAGLGASVLPRLATPQGDHPIIITKTIRDPVIRRTIGIVERRHVRLSPAAQRFRDMLAASWSD
ncbi:MAG: LysR family transcriptional regulator [Rhizobiales bacterium 62-17]|nr:LysR family transcriptional regulator [Hyphomicrobiales bacterium]OJY02068.1 MAG: LysR family transcriptional regulator [Rhizobiales bacterium 62-17]